MNIPAGGVATLGGKNGKKLNNKEDVMEEKKDNREFPPRIDRPSSHIPDKYGYFGDGIITYLSLQEHQALMQEKDKEYELIKAECDRLMSGNIKMAAEIERLRKALDELRMKCGIVPTTRKALSGEGDDE